MRTGACVLPSAISLNPEQEDDARCNLNACVHGSCSDNVGAGSSTAWL